MISPDFCPRFIKCSANICPLDKDWKQRTHLKDERVCYFLREHAKQLVSAKKEGGYPTILEKKVSQEYPRIISHFSDIKKQCERSAKIALKKQEKDQAA